MQDVDARISNVSILTVRRAAGVREAFQPLGSTQGRGRRRPPVGLLLASREHSQSATRKATEYDLSRRRPSPNIRVEANHRSVLQAYAMWSPLKYWFLPRLKASPFIDPGVASERCASRFWVHLGQRNSINYVVVVNLIPLLRPTNCWHQLVCCPTPGQNSPCQSPVLSRLAGGLSMDFKFRS